MQSSQRIMLGLICAITAGTISASPPSPMSSCVPNHPETSQNYDATHWYRASAERIALYRQAYTIALEKIHKHSAHHQTGHWGVIMDIDETVLDNSQFEKDSILNCHNYQPAENYAFMEQAISVATPGAQQFTCSVQKLGGKVILVTNRNGHFDQHIQPATIENLTRAGICFDNVVFAQSNDDINKTPRFEAVAKGDYTKLLAQTTLGPIQVLGYVGDNIQDFPNAKQAEILQQDPEHSAFYAKFGEEYFSLPNPTYGSWQGNPFN